MTDIPKTAERLAAKARANGARAGIQAARGIWSGKKVDLVLVKIDRPDGRAVVTWVNGKAAGAWRWPVEGHFMGRQKCGYRDVNAWVSERIKADDDVAGL